MSLITIATVRKEYGADIILQDINLRVARGEKIGIVGKNGGGKTTLMRLLLRQEETTAGTITIASGITLGYLAQVQVLDTERTVLEEAQTVLAELVELESRLRDAEAHLEMMPDDEEALDAYAMARDRFDFSGGAAAEQNLLGALAAMGFTEADFEKRVGVLSGGECTRLAMAKLLASSPDVLLLDEPTNHLDIRAVEWLEGFLTRFPGAVLVVSHDRRFLRSVAQTVWEIEAERVTVYKGGYESYRTQRAANRARQAEEYSRQQAEIARIEEYIRRNIAGQNTRNAQGRRKQLSRLERVEQVVTEPRKMAARLQSSGRSGLTTVVAERASKAYGNKKLLDNATFTLYRGDKVGVVGPNGVGKTTLIEMLMGIEPLDAGYLRVGQNVTVAYHKQEQDDFEPDEVVLEALYNRAEMTVGEARNHLGRFLFTADDVFKPVSALSGGERAKLAMALMTLSPANLLILDEPTNHLDVFSCDALTEALQQFNGTMLLISHDRELLDAVTNHTLHLYGDGKFCLRTGSYSAMEDTEVLAGKPPNAPAAPATPAKKNAPPPPPPALSAHALAKERQKAKKRVETIEAEVAALEARLAEITATLSTPGADALALSQEYATQEAALTEKLSQWEAATLEAEELGT